MSILWKGDGKMTKGFNLKEKRREIFETLIKNNRHSHMKKWLFAIMKEIESQDKEFIKLLKDGVEGQPQLTRALTKILVKKIDELSGETK